MCGGYRISLRGSELRVSYSPRVRGLSGKLFRSISLLRVFPRVRGLSVVLSTVTRWLEVFPPVCGGYRSCCPRLPAGWKYSPRMRGLSEVFDLIQKGTDVFPPHAGVIALEKQKTTEAGYSPPCAGVIGYQWGKIFICKCIPPHAGVIGNISGNPLRRILPACGGYRRKRQPS